MDVGKPTGSKATWWSRPTEGHAPHERPVRPAEPPEPVRPVAEPVVPPQGAAGEPQDRPRPLHEPDAYSTPPYGGPGPWAPAPPVQRPVPTPAHGIPVPPSDFPLQQPQPLAQPLPRQLPPGQGVFEQPQPQPQPPAPDQPGTTSQWSQYDPWADPPQQDQRVQQIQLAGPHGQQPLTHFGEPVKRRRSVGLVGAVLIALVAGAVGGGVGVYSERNGGFGSVQLPQAAEDNGGRAPDSVAGIAASALPGVVTLHVSGKDEQGTGTGFVLDREGHILTNNHVVEPAGSSGEISVTFSGGQTAKATVVGKDSGYDLAVVKVTGISGLRPLALGNSDSVQVGDPVVAIGAPFDLSNTVTSGIISAKDRPITAGGEKGDGSDVSYVDALQTDAPINPGNSGGPLVDTKARVIGINSAIRAADSGSQTDGGQAGSIGLGFAIPINQGKRVAEELINTGKATHPVIGVTLDTDFTGDGARVAAQAAGGGPAVTSGGPGAKAGIRPGDVISAVDGERVHSGEELIIKIRAHRPGDRLALTLSRGGKELTMSLALGSSDVM
ncbi:protease [Streptomyces sp. 150FB]|uniref:S1C family serine protease n=1 Tax=Streptomyces sp. 150FB TaxID=1576605 RepID=UPI00058916D2|nr:trypsin-like peptidase domain-containing protein [Streptomyces sp. 150FB]KIF76555.1 protease [Streptomyces sp. 150FB]